VQSGEGPRTIRTVGDRVPGVPSFKILSIFFPRIALNFLFFAKLQIRPGYFLVQFLLPFPIGLTLYCFSSPFLTPVRCPPIFPCPVPFSDRSPDRHSHKTPPPLPFAYFLELILTSFFTRASMRSISSWFMSASHRLLERFFSILVVRVSSITSSAKLPIRD